MKETAFADLSGKKISRLELEQMIYFLADGGQNLFNDGVIEEDFLKRELGDTLFTYCKERFSSELALRHLREKNYAPYVHPNLPTLSAKNIWGILAPALKENLAKLQQATDPLSLEVFRARSALYLAEKEFPPNMLKQSIFYKSRDYEDCPPDLRLYRSDLSLFGYHNLTDWFGREFVQMAAAVIFNAAAFAEKCGYRVSTDEVEADLLFRIAKHDEMQKRGKAPWGEASYGALNQKNIQEQYRDTLQKMQMSEPELVRLWQKVLLFRRLFEDVEAAAWIDTHAMREFFSYAREYATIELYQLPSAFCFSTETQWQEFATYLDYACLPSNSSKEIPETLATIQEIEAKAPELIKEKLTLMMATFDKKELEARVGIKDAWDWEVENGNWEILKNRYPLLSDGVDGTKSERHALLDLLDEKTRASVDAYARGQIVDAHPEWIKEALEKAESVKRIFYLRLDHTHSPIDGIDDIGALYTLLEKNDPLHLACYTQNKNTYFKISFSEKGEKSLLSFLEASKEGVLSQLLEKRLRSHYLEIREIGGGYDFKNHEGIWKAFQDVKKQVSSDFFAPLERALVKSPEMGIRQALFFPYFEQKKLKVQNPDYQESDQSNLEWKIEKKIVTLTRSNPGAIPLDDLNALKIGEFSDIGFSSTIGPYFYRLIERNKDVTLPLENYLQAKGILGKETKCHFLTYLLKEMSGVLDALSKETSPN